MSTTSAELASAELISGSQPATSTGPIGWIKANIEAYRIARERRAAASALMALDDHLLRDIGLDRSEIMSAVHGRDADLSRRDRHLA